MLSVGPITPNAFKAIPGWSIEPSILRKKNNLVFGLRLESYYRPNIEKCYSYTLNVRYYFSSNKSAFNPDKFNPFVGLGMGIYNANPRDTVVRFQTRNGVRGILWSFVEGVDGARWGFYPRAGFSYKNFYVMAEYNFIYRQRIRTVYYFDTATGTKEWSTPYHYRSDNYFALKLGFFFHRQKKKTHPQNIPH